MTNIQLDIVHISISLNPKRCGVPSSIQPMASFQCGEHEKHQHAQTQSPESHILHFL